MDAISIDYYRRREARGRTLADAALGPDIAAIHRSMAREYREKIDLAHPATVT